MADCISYSILQARMADFDRCVWMLPGVLFRRSVKGILLIGGDSAH
jgi:hypothetical protein